jgi:hypothetical protein
VTATQAERTELTLRFNDRLREHCAGLGIVYVESTLQQLDPETALVRKDLLNRDRNDHHLDRAKYAEIVADALAPHITAS